MSWAEVKKLNSDLSTPLNLAALINHIDLIGDSYVGSSDEAVMLLKSNGLYSHEVARTVVFDLLNGDTATGAAMREYIDSKLSASTGVGAWLALIGDIDNAALVACNDMNAVVASETAMTAVVASETAMTAVAASETAMTAVAANETAMTTILASETSMNAVIASETAMNAVIASETAMNAVIASETACSAIRGSSTAITALDASNPITVPTMTSNTTPSGEASASSFLSAGYDAWKAFDKVNTSYWVSNTNTNSWLKYQFVSDVWCYKVVVKAIADNQSIKNCKVQYSSNGTDWTDGQAILVSNANTNEQEFAVAKPSGKVKHWRLFCIDNYGNNYLTVDEVNFYCK